MVEELVSLIWAVMSSQSELSGLHKTNRNGPGRPLTSWPVFFFRNGWLNEPVRKKNKWRERGLELWPVSRGTEIRVVIKSSYLNWDVAEDCCLRAPWPVCHFHYLWQADSIAINIHLLPSQLDTLLYICSTTHQHCAGLPEVKKSTKLWLQIVQLCLLYSRMLLSKNTLYFSSLFFCSDFPFDYLTKKSACAILTAWMSRGQQKDSFMNKLKTNLFTLKHKIL